MTAVLPTQGVRYDFDALEVAMGRPGAQVVANVLGVTMRTVHRARLEGIDERHADGWACRAGVHPGTVWPHWWSAEAIAATGTTRQWTPRVSADACAEPAAVAKPASRREPVEIGTVRAQMRALLDAVYVKAQS